MIEEMVPRPGGASPACLPSSGIKWRGMVVRVRDLGLSGNQGLMDVLMFWMSKKDNISRVWDIIENVGVCMLTTQFVGGLRARPLEARPDRDAGLIFFVTDIHSAKESEIESMPDVGLVFIDAGDKAYLSITGRACVLRDAYKTKAAWRRTDEVWWPGGPDNPDVCLLQIEPFTAELWDGPASTVVTAFEFAKAELNGEEPQLGENRKLTIKM
jgi:general stress protein 26